MISDEDKKDVARHMGSKMASKVATATNDSKSKALGKKLETHIKQGKWNRGWGHTYKVDNVYRGRMGKIGSLQTVKRGGRVERTTHGKDQYGVIGHDISYLEKYAK